MRLLEILRRCRHGTRRDARVVRQLMREDAPLPAKPNNSDLHTHGERVGVDMPFGPIFSGVIFSHQAVCGPSRGAPWSADAAGAPGPRPKSLFAFSGWRVAGTGGLWSLRRDPDPPTRTRSNLRRSRVAAF